MFVKVTGDADHGNTLWETPGPVEFGFYSIPFEDEDGNGPTPKYSELPAMPSLFYVREIDSSQRTKYELSKGLVSVRFAWWPDPEHGSVGVVTTRSIFIMGPTGDTIDRV